MAGLRAQVAAEEIGLSGAVALVVDGPQVLERPVDRGLPLHDHVVCIAGEDVALRFVAGVAAAIAARDADTAAPLAQVQLSHLVDVFPSHN